MIWGSPWLIRLNANGNASIHHLKSVLDSWEKDMVLSKFLFHVPRAYITPGKLDVISPNTSATVLIQGQVVASKFSQASFNFRARSWVNDTCIKIELRTNPKKTIIWVGTKSDFSGWIMNPTLSSRVTGSITFCIYRWKLSAGNKNHLCRALKCDLVVSKMRKPV